jgi:hypothetical protein
MTPYDWSWRARQRLARQASARRQRAYATALFVSTVWAGAALLWWMA